MRASAIRGCSPLSPDFGKRRILDQPSLFPYEVLLVLVATTRTSPAPLGGAFQARSQDRRATRGDHPKMRGQEMNAIVDVNFLLRTPPPDLGCRLREATLPAQSRSRILRFPMIFDTPSAPLPCMRFRGPAAHTAARVPVDRARGLSGGAVVGFNDADEREARRKGGGHEAIADARLGHGYPFQSVTVLLRPTPLVRRGALTPCPPAARLAAFHPSPLVEGPMKADATSLILTFALAALLLNPSALFGQTFLTADGQTDTYSLISSVLGGNPIEPPDCSHPEFGPHITQEWDSDLGKYSFVFSAYRVDSERPHG